jgi:hypothetical protein
MTAPRKTIAVAPETLKPIVYWRERDVGQIAIREGNGWLQPDVLVSRGR